MLLPLHAAAAAAAGLGLDLELELELLEAAAAAAWWWWCHVAAQLLRLARAGQEEPAGLLGCRCFPFALKYPRAGFGLTSSIAKPRYGSVFAIPKFVW